MKPSIKFTARYPLVTTNKGVIAPKEGEIVITDETIEDLKRANPQFDFEGGFAITINNNSIEVNLF